MKHLRMTQHKDRFLWLTCEKSDLLFLLSPQFRKCLLQQPFVMSQRPLKCPFKKKKKKLFVVVFCWLWKCKTFWVALCKRSQAWGFTSSTCWCIPLHRDLHKKICLDGIIEYHLFIAEMKNSSDQVYLPFIKWETGIFLYCCGLMEGAAASHRKIFSGLQNWAQDQHIEYAWLSFHPGALIQYSQRKKKKRLLGIDQDGCWGI